MTRMAAGCVGRGGGLAVLPTGRAPRMGDFWRNFVYRVVNSGEFTLW